MHQAFPDKGTQKEIALLPGQTQIIRIHAAAVGKSFSYKCELDFFEVKRSVEKISSSLDKLVSATLACACVSISYSACRACRHGCCVRKSMWRVLSIMTLLHAFESLCCVCCFCCAALCLCHAPGPRQSPPKGELGVSTSVISINIFTRTHVLVFGPVLHDRTRRSWF